MILLENHIRASQALYRAWLLCALVPWANERARSRLEAPKKSVKEDPSFAAMAVKHGLKGAGTEMIDMAENASKYSHAIKEATLDHAEAALSGEPTSPQGFTDIEYRVKQGKSLRNWGPRWRDSVIFALLVEVSRSGTSETGDPFQILRSSTKLMTAERGEIIERYARWLKRLESLKLLDVAAMKPIVNGNRIQEELGDLRGGPWLKTALDMVIEWQLGNPDADAADEASKARAIAEVLSRKEELMRK